MKKNYNLYTIFSDAISASDDIDFLHVPHGPSLKYRDTEEASGRFHAVLESLGVMKGDRVVVQVEKSIESVLLYLACLRIGAIYIPLNTAYTPAEVSYFIDDAEPRVFICDPVAHESLDSILHNKVSQILSLSGNGTGSLVELYNEMDAVNDIVHCSADDLAAILYTSGTTGRSKGAMLTHSNLSSNAQVLHQYWAFQPGDILLHALPIFHVHGLFVALHCALLNGSTIYFLPRFDANTVLQVLPVMHAVGKGYAVHLNIPSHVHVVTGISYHHGLVSLQIKIGQDFFQHHGVRLGTCLVRAARYVEIMLQT